VPFTDADSPLEITVVALGNADGRESAASVAQKLLKQFATPTLSGSITYSGTTASMTYNVASGVTAVQLRKASDNSALGSNYTPSGTSVAISYNFSNVTVDVVVVALGNTTDGRESAASVTQTLLRQFATPVKASGPVYTTVNPGSYTASMAYNVDAGVTAVQVMKASDTTYSVYPPFNAGQTLGIPITLTNFPVLNAYPLWDMRIAFRSTGKNNAWRALIGDMRTGYVDRGWGVWITDVNKIQFSWSSVWWDTTLTVAQNTDYVLTITKTTTSLKIDLLNVVANTTQTDTNASIAGYTMSEIGPVTLGGWIVTPLGENFVGTISYVTAVPALASAIASSGSATITVPFTDAASPLEIKVVALANSVGRESAATQTLLKQFAAPVKASEPVYTTVSANSYTASMTYTVAPGVTAVNLSDVYSRFVLSNSALFIGGNLTNVANGPRGTISMWWEFTNATNGYLWSSRSNTVYGEACVMERTGSNIRITLRNQVDVVGDFVTTSNPIATGGSYHLFASWDLSTTPARHHIYVNGVAQPLSGSVTTGQTVSYATSITGSGFGAHMYDPPVPVVNGRVGLAYINYAEYVDPSISSNIRKFISSSGRPVALGPTGALPTGNTPIVFLNSGNGTNSGSGGNFSQQNTVTSEPITTIVSNTVNTGTNTASLVVAFTDAVSPLDITVVALANAASRESAASAAQTLLKQFAAPVKASEPVYTTVSANSYTASMTYTVAPGVTAVNVLSDSYSRFVLSDSALSIVNLTNVANGPRGTISMWWEFTHATDGYLWSSRSNTAYGEACVMERTGSNIQIILRNQVSTPTVGNFATTSNPIVTGGSYHLFASWDLSTGRYHIYVNGVAQPLSGSVTTGQTVSYATSITKSGFGAYMFDTPSTFVNGRVGLAYINYVEYVDPTISSNISKFISSSGRPVALGPTGALPTGNSPIVFLNSGNGTNSGYGGIFSQYNTVTSEPTTTVVSNTVNTGSNTASLVVAFVDAVSPLDITVVALANSVGRESAASAAQTLLKQFAAPVKASEPVYTETFTSGSRLVTASMTYTVATGVTRVSALKASDTTYSVFPSSVMGQTLDNFPIQNAMYPRWEMSIAFRSTGKNNQWRALIGDTRNQVNTGNNTGWSVYISDTNTFVYIGSNATAFWNATTITFAQNTDYVLTLTKTSASLTLEVTNVTANTTQTVTNTTIASNSLSPTNGPVTLGGWIDTSSDNFVGTISYVNVIPALASTTASGMSASITVPLDESQNVQVVALANSAGRGSAAATPQLLNLFKISIPGYYGVVSPMFMFHSHVFSQAGTFNDVAHGYNWNDGYDNQSSLFVSDTTRHIVLRYNLIPTTENLAIATYSGVAYGTTNSSGTGANHLYNPRQVAYNYNTKRIAIADWGNDRIVTRSVNGSFTISFGTTGTANGRFNKPSGVAFDTSGNIVVADTGNNRIQIFNGSNYSHIRTWGTYGTVDGLLNSPRHVAITAFGHVIVADNNRVQIFDQYGTFITRLPGTFIYPGVTVDNIGQIIVADEYDQMHLFTSGGTLIRTFGSLGSGNGEFNNPHAVTVDNFGRIYVSEKTNNRISIFINPAPPQAGGGGVNENVLI
jgi:hypothetical protein